MTININKDVGSKSNITFKGLGDPGPFSFAIIKGTLPVGTTFDQTTGELKGNFTQKGDFDVTVAGKKKDRIEGVEDFTFNVTDWTLHKTDFKGLTDASNISWTTSGSVTKIINDPDIFGGECYELTGGRLAFTLPEAIGTRDFEIDFIFKPINNGGGGAYGRILMIGPNSTSGMFYFCRNSTVVPPQLLFQHCPNGSASYANSFPNVSSPLTDDWNHILLVRKDGTLTYFLNGVREQEASFGQNLDRRELYIGANNSGSETFQCRVKRLQIRVYDSKQFFTPPLVTDVWRYKLTERRYYPLTSVDRNDYLVASNFKGTYTTRIKEGYFLPTGLVLRNNRISGNSPLEDNRETKIELLINGVVNDEVTIKIINKDIPNRVFNLPLTGSDGNTVIGDTDSRIWEKLGSDSLVKNVNDTDNLKDISSTYFWGGGLRLKNDSFAVGYDDFCVSFWAKPSHGSNSLGGRRLFSIKGDDDAGQISIQYAYVSTETPAFFLNAYIVGNGMVSLTGNNTPVPIINNLFNHIVIARKNNVWRVLVNGKVMVENYYLFNITAKGFIIGTNGWNSDYFLGNMFDFKMSHLTLDYWDTFEIPLITKWPSNDVSILDQIGIPIQRVFKNPWPNSGVKYKVKDTSALPLGFSLNENGLLSGTASNATTGSSIIECYINDVFNHVANFNYEFVVDVKSRFLTHSVKASANKDGLAIVRNVNTIATNAITPTLTDVGPMLSQLFKNPYTDFNSSITIPHGETAISKKAFCMEIEVYFKGGLAIQGRASAATSNRHTLFSKGGGGANTDQFLTIDESNGIYSLTFSTGTTFANPLSFNVPIEFDPSKRNHIAMTYDLEKVRLFVNGTLVYTADWAEGWSSSATQILEIGQNAINGYLNWFLAYNGFFDNFKLYQGNAIYVKDFTPDINKANLYPEFPIIEPNVAYKGYIAGVSDHTVTLQTGTLPTGLVLSSDGRITGTCTATSGDFPITLAVTKDSVVETFKIELTVAQYVLDLDLNNAITNGTLTDKRSNLFTVSGGVTIQADSRFPSGRSIYFNGVDGYLSIAQSDIFKLGKTSFVLEFDFIAAAEPLPNGGSFPGIISQRGDGTNQHAFSVWLATGYTQAGNNDKIPLDIGNQMSVGMSLTSTGTTAGTGTVEISNKGMVKDKLYKVKFVRANGMVRLYVDGRLERATAMPDDTVLFSSQQDLLIGCLNNIGKSNRFFNGYIGSLRVYVPNSADLFTKKVRPENIVSWFDISKSTADKIVDYNTANKWTQPVPGVVFSNGEMVFNGASHLQAESIFDWDFGASDFTMEYEVNFDSTNTQVFQGLLSKRRSANDLDSFTTHFNWEGTTANFGYFVFNLKKDGASGVIGEVKGLISRNKYIKISITRAYKKLYLHVDGVLRQELVTTDDQVFWSTLAPVLLGVTVGSGSKSSRYFKGKIKHFRVLKGIALYNRENYTEFSNLNDTPSLDELIPFKPEDLGDKIALHVNTDDVTQITWSGNRVHKFSSFDNKQFGVTPTSYAPTLNLTESRNGYPFVNFGASATLLNSDFYDKVRGKTYFWCLSVIRKSTTTADNGNDRPIFQIDRTDNSGYLRISAGNLINASNKDKYNVYYRTQGNLNYSNFRHSQSIEGETGWFIGLTQVDTATGDVFLHVNGRKESFKGQTGVFPENNIDYFSLCSSVVRGGFVDFLMVSFGFLPMSDTEVDKLIGFAAKKYGLQGLLPDTHPYKSKTPLSDRKKITGVLFDLSKLENKPDFILDSDNVVVKSDKITSLVDTSGNGNSFVSPTDELAPYVGKGKINGHKTVAFVYNHRLALANKALYRKKDFIWLSTLVKKDNSVAGEMDLLRVSTSLAGNFRFGLKLASSDNPGGSQNISVYLRKKDTETYTLYDLGPSNGINWMFITFAMDLKAGTLLIFVNGNKKTIDLGFSGAVTDDTDSLYNPVISGYPDTYNANSTAFTGDLLFMASGTSRISEDELMMIDGFNADKYNLTRLLPATHPYKNTPPFVKVAGFDPYYSDVTALFPFESDLLDVKGNTWTIEGTPAISQEKAIIGNSSVKFTGTASALTIPSIFNNYDTFTIDFWAATLGDVVGNANRAYHPIITQCINSGNGEQRLSIRPPKDGGKIFFDRKNAFQPTCFTESTTTIDSSNWNHYEFSWDGLNYRLFVNGILESTFNSAVGWFNTNQPLRIGREYMAGYASNANSLNGYLKYLRITKGIVRHKSNFVPPTTVSEYNKSTSIKEYDQYWNNVTLLLKGDGTDGSTDIIDSSKLNLPVKTRLGVTVKANQSKFDQSLFYPATGTGNILLYDWNENLHLNGDFTIDFWYYPTGVGGQILNMGGGINIAWASYQISWDYNDNKSICFAASSTNSNIDIGGETGPSGKFGEPTLNAWNHIEITRQGNQWRCFLNGALGLSITSSNNPYNSTPRGLQVGGRYDYNWNSGTPGSSISGYIDNLRITKGVARHVSNFTPPTNVDQYSNVSISTTKDFRNRALELQPIGYWPLDDNSGTVARDISGNGFHGDITWGTPVFNGDRLKPGSSKSMGFLSGSTCVQVPIAQAGKLLSDLAATGKEFTIIYLFKKISNSTYNIGFAGWESAANSWAAVVVNDVYLNAPNGSITLPQLPVNGTQFVAWKKDFKAGKYKALCDGVWYNSSSNINETTTGKIINNPLQFPGSGVETNTSHGVRGYYSDVIVFNKALTDSQIEELYNLLDKASTEPETPNYRYYRVLSTSSNVPGSWIELQEAELASELNGTDITTPTTPMTSDSYYQTSTEVMKPQCLVDNDLTNPDTGAYSPLHATTVSNPTWFQFDLGEKKPLEEMRIMGRNKTDYYLRGLGEFDILGSNDAVNYELIKHFKTTESYKPLTYKKYRLKPIKYRYFKVEVYETQEGGNAGYVAIGRFALLNKGVVVTNTSNTLATASSNYAEHLPSNVLKTTAPQNISDVWASATPNAPEWIMFDLMTPVEVDQVKIMPQNDQWVVRGPKIFRILGSNNGTVWDIIRDFSNVIGWTMYTWQTFDLNIRDEDKSVVSLLQFNEPAGTTTLNETVNSNTWNVSSAVTLGGGVLTIEPNGNYYGLTPAEASLYFKFGYEPFTIEFIFRPTKINTRGYGDGLLWWQTGNQANGLVLSIDATGKFEIRTTLDNRLGVTLDGLNPNGNSHFAVTRVRNNIYLSLNGVTTKHTFDCGNVLTTSDFGIGVNGSYGFVGTIDAMKVTKGIPLYTTVGSYVQPSNLIK